MRTIDPVKHEEKRLEILKAAGRCFARDGFRGATISDICTEAKISPGHLYHYFASKEAIMGAMAEVGLEHAAAHFSRMAQGSNAVEALLAELGHAEADKHCDDRHLLLDMLTESARNPAMAAILREHSRQLRTLLADFLRDGQKRRQVDPTFDADLAAAILMSIFDGAHTLTIRDPELDTAASVDLLKILISRFLTPPAAITPLK